MKKLISLFIFLACCSTYSQSLSVFDVDPSKFPNITAKFYALDAKNDQILNLSPSDFNISEMSVLRNIISVSCPNPKPTVPLSVAMSIDNSGSMGYTDYGELPVKLGKTTATDIVNILVNSSNEMAVQSCDAHARIIQDFTNDKNKLITAINSVNAGGDNNFVEQFLNKLTGLFNVAKTGKNRRIAILYTDAWWYALQPNELKQCIDACNKYGITFFGIIYTRQQAEPNGIKKSIKAIADATGGEMFDGVTSTEAAKILASILTTKFNVEPCTIEWEGDFSCEKVINVACELKTINKIANFTYPASVRQPAKVEIKPLKLILGDILKGKFKDTSINISAYDRDLIITKFNISNPNFTITPSSLTIPAGTTKPVSIRYNCTQDTVFELATVKLESNSCSSNSFYIKAGSNKNPDSRNKYLTVTYPNGSENFIIGTDSIITWEGVLPEDSVQLEYSYDSGTIWHEIVPIATNLKYIWKNIPKPASIQCLVGANLLNNSVKTDTTIRVKFLKGHQDAVTSVAFSPDESMITSGSRDNTVKIWNAQSESLIKTFTGHSNYVYSVAFSPYGDQIASGSYDKTIKLWNFDTGALIRTFNGHTEEVSSIAFSPDGTKIASASADKTIIIWDVNSGNPLKTLTGHSDWVESVAFNIDGDKIISSSSDMTIKLWDVNSGSLIKTFDKSSSDVPAVAFSPDGTKVASGNCDNVIELWDVETGKVIKTFTGHSNNVYGVAFNTEGTKIASGSLDQTVKIWDVNSGNLDRTLSGHTSYIYSVAFSPDDSKIASACEDMTVGVWSLNNGPKIVDTDVSDNLFSIVEPKISSFDINMGKVLIGSAKDSVIQAFIKNIGSYPARIDSIKFKNNYFKLTSGTPPYSIDPGNEKSVEIEFKPSKIGVVSDIITIYTQSETLQTNIIGEGVQPQLQIISNLIDFGKVYVGRSKDTIVVTIKNISSADINITKINQNGPNKIDFSIMNGHSAFILKPYDSRSMELRFKPSDIGRTSGSIQFEYNGIGSPAEVQLFGEGLKIITKITTNSPICEGDDLLLFADSIANATYNWYGPYGFKSNQQNPILSNAKSIQSGKYYLYATVGNVNSDTLSIDISISTFLVSPGDSSLIFVGTAVKMDKYIKLTNPVKWDGGSIWLKNRFSVKQDFVTTFKFRYKYGNNDGNDDGSLPGADGIAFVMQNHNYPVLGVKGGSMGYTGITNSLAIEFDLYKNPWDPNGNHIAVQSMGAEANQPDHTKFNSCMGITSNIISIKQDSMYYAKIEYDWATKTLKIYLDSTGNFESPALSIPNIDLASYLQLEEGEYVYIGFTAGTGESYQEHDLFDWTIPCKNQLVDVEDKNLKIENTEELSISPNPASHDAVISYNKEKESNVSLMIINAFGQEISKPISNVYHNTGTFRYNLETSSLAQGVFMVILQKGSERISKMFLIVK
jgi:WD40 repeat protein